MNNYDVPEIIELGTAQKLILDQKQLSPLTDSLGVPFSTEPDSADDFDE